MSNKEDVIAELDRFFRNTLYTSAETLDALEELRDEIDMKIDALETDMKLNGQSREEE